jgi:hypothetical protein
MHDLGVVLDFKESTIKIDEILLPIRDIANLQLKASITTASNFSAFHAPYLFDKKIIRCKKSM